jgi:hypothetical protein
MARPRKYLIKKTCCRCGGPGPFGKNRRAPDGLQYWCIDCQKKYNSKQYKKHKKKIDRKNKANYYKHRTERLAHAKKHRKQNLARDLWAKARKRAREKGLPFDITPSDVLIPRVCPLLNIPLRCGDGVSCRNSPTLDRKKPELGYVKSNVWVISHKANTIKQDAALDELQLLVKNLKAHLGR